MQIHKTLPATINPTMVRNTLGVYGGLPVNTYSVGDLITLAKIGGITITGRSVKSAFAISETGGSTGKLIAGAEPYWNIYAAFSPGLWYLEGTVDTNVYELIMYLKTYPNQSNYGFRFDGFIGHNMGARKLSLFLSADDSTPMTEIDMGYNDDKASSFKLYPDRGELNWADIFLRASFTWLLNPYFKVKSIVKGGSDINIENLSETGTLSFPEANGVANGGGYLLATINNTTLYIGSNSVTVKLGVGNGQSASSLFGLKNFDAVFNLKVKERVHFSSEYIVLFGSAATETTTFDLTSQFKRIRPADAETFVGKYPPYVGARYTITANLQMLITRAGVEAYITKVAVTDQGDLNQAITDGNAFKIANLTYYDYVSPSYLYPISYTGTFPAAIIDDTYTLVMLVVSNVE